MAGPSDVLRAAGRSSLTSALGRDRAPRIILPSPSSGGGGGGTPFFGGTGPSAFGGYSSGAQPPRVGVSSLAAQAEYEPPNAAWRASVTGENERNKAPSLMQQAGGLLGSLGPGLVDLTRAVGASPFNFAEGVGDMAASIPGSWNDMLGDEDFFKDLNITYRQKGLSSALAQGARNFAPLASDIADSLLNTVDVAGIQGDQEWIGERYGAAINEGTILPTLVEDIGNIGLLAAGAGGIAGRAGSAATRVPAAAQVARSQGLRGVLNKATQPGPGRRPSVKIARTPEGRVKVKMGLAPPKRSTGLVRAAEAAGAPRAAAQIARFGHRARQFGIGAEYLQPENVLMYPLLRGGGKIATAVAKTKTAQNMAERVYARQSKYEMSTDAQIMETAHQAAGNYMSRQVEELVGGGRGAREARGELNDLLSSVMLNATDAQLAGVMDAILRADDPAQIVEIMNRSRPDKAKITLEQAEALRDYLNETMDPELRSIIDGSVAIMDDYLDAETAMRLADDKIEPWMTEVPTALVNRVDEASGKRVSTVQKLTDIKDIKARQRLMDARPDPKTGRFAGNDRRTQDGKWYDELDPKQQKIFDDYDNLSPTERRAADAVVERINRSRADKPTTLAQAEAFARAEGGRGASVEAILKAWDADRAGLKAWDPETQGGYVNYPMNPEKRAEGVAGEQAKLDDLVAEREALRGEETRRERDVVAAVADAARRNPDKPVPLLVEALAERGRSSDTSVGDLVRSTGATEGPSLASLMDQTKSTLLEMARHDNIGGRSSMNKTQLAEALYQHYDSEVSSYVDPAGPVSPEIFEADPAAPNLGPGTLVARNSPEFRVAEEAFDTERPIQPLSEGEAVQQAAGRLNTEIDATRAEIASLDRRIAAQRDRVNRFDEVTARMNIKNQAESKARDASDAQTTAIKGLSNKSLGGRVRVGGPTSRKFRLTGLAAEIGRRFDIAPQIMQEIEGVYQRRRVEMNRLKEEARAQGLSEKDVNKAFEEYDLSFRPEEGIEADATAEALLRIVDDPQFKLGDAEGDIFAAIVRRDLEKRAALVPTDNPLGPILRDEAIRARYDSYGPEFRNHVSDTFVQQLDTATGQYLKELHKTMQDMGDRSAAYFPAALRTPIAQARLAFQDLVSESIRQWGLKTPESRDLARAYTTTAMEMTTGLAEFYRTAKADPKYLGAGGVGQEYYQAQGIIGERKGKPFEVPETAMEQFRTAGLRPNKIREYSPAQGREMRRYIQQKALLQAATDPRFSASVRDVLPEHLVAILEGGGTVPMNDVFKALQAGGWRLVDIRGLGEAHPRYLRDGRQAQIPDEFGEVRTTQDVGMDEAGTYRTGIQNADSADVPIGVPGEQFAEFLSGSGMDLRVMRERLATEFTDLMMQPNHYGRMYDEINSIWKTGTLAFSTTWAIYNAVGNMIMAWTMAGMPPHRVLLEGRRVQNAIRQSAAEQGIGVSGKRRGRQVRESGIVSEFIPGGVAETGMSYVERQRAYDLTEDSTPPPFQSATARKLAAAPKTVLNYLTNRDRSIFGSFTEAMYGFNTTVDNFVRSAVYMDRVHKLAPEVPAELLDSNGNIRQDLTAEQWEQLRDIDAKAHKAMDDAARAAINTMGDFNRLTRLERRAIKRVFPFWPWMRHQAEMLVRMPLTNPQRWALMMSLADIIGDEYDEMSAEGQLRGMTGFTGLGAGLLGMEDSGLVGADFTPMIPVGQSPFSGAAPGQAEQGGLSTMLDPKAIARSVSPVISFLPELTTGVRLSTLDQGSRPQDQSIIGDYGQTERFPGTLARALSGDVAGALGEVGYRTAGLTGFTRAARDAVLGPTPRYSSGDEINAPDRMGSGLNRVLSGLRVPLLPRDLSTQLYEAQAKDTRTGFYPTRRP